MQRARGPMIISRWRASMVLSAIGKRSFVMFRYPPQRSRSRCRALSACAAVTLILATLFVTVSRLALADTPTTPTVLVGGMSVLVTEEQRVSLSGEAASIGDVVTEVCRQAGVELRGYAGPANRYFGTLQDVSLSDAFRSLLREQSYAVGLRAGDATTAPRIVWLRVLGGDPEGPTLLQAALPHMSAADDDAASTSAAGASPIVRSTPSSQTPDAPPQPAIPFIIPPQFLFEAFNTVDLDLLDEGQRKVLGAIADKPEIRRHFLATSAADLAAIFRPYRDAAGTVRRLQSLATDRDIQSKLDEVARTLDPSR
jgi:hypothetical protein